MMAATASDILLAGNLAISGITAGIVLALLIKASPIPCECKCQCGERSEKIQLPDPDELLDEIDASFERPFTEEEKKPLLWNKWFR